MKTLPFNIINFYKTDWEYLFAGIVIFIGLFFLFRELIAWYWKINEAIELLKKIEENTRPNGNVEKLNTIEKPILENVIIKSKFKEILPNPTVLVLITFLLSVLITWTLMRI
jgi:hypothetical protein